MPNDSQIAPKMPIKARSKPFLDSYEPGKAIPKAPYGGNLVKPEDRVAKVSADAPKIDTESSPSDNIFTPDRSGTSSIRDK